MRRHTVMMTPNKHSKARGILAITALLGLQGCIWVDDTQDLATFVTEVQAKPKGTIEPLPTFEPYHSFVYQGASLRDPFIPLVKVESTLANFELRSDDGLQPDRERPRSYLEQFSIDDLFMVGTIGQSAEQNNKFWALVLDQNGEIHRIAEGDYMGLDFGRVVAVSEQDISVVEIISDGRGGWMQRPRKIKLTEQE